MARSETKVEQHRDGERWIDPWTDLPDLGDVCEPPPPPEEPRWGRGPGGVPRPARDAGMSPWLVAAAASVLLVLFALQVVAMTVGAHAGPAVALGLCALIGVVFVVPFWLGAVWLGRQRDPGRW